MKVSFILILISSCMLCCLQAPESALDSNSFKLAGIVHETNGGSVILQYLNADSTYITDTCIIKEQEFVATGKIKEPTYTVIEYYSKAGELLFKREDVLLEPAKLNIEVHPRQDNYVLNGSASDKHKLQVDSLVNPLYKQMELLEKENSPNADSIYEVLDEKANMLLRDFVQNNPDEYYSAVLLNQLILDISLEDLKKSYATLSVKVKSTSKGKELLSDISSLEKVSKGKPAPDFKTVDFKNSPVILSAFRGKKHILIDFWASWCKPCREGMPHLKELYQTYSSKGLEVIAISDDEDRTDWLEAIKADATYKWINILSKSNRNDISSDYFIWYIPTKFLIDKNGNIIGRYGHKTTDTKRLESDLKKVCT